MSFLSRLFGTKKPTSSDLEQAIEQTNADLSSAREQFEAHKKTLANIANLSPEDHTSAENGRDEARRAIERGEAKLAELTPAHEAAKAEEARNALIARRDAVERRVFEEAPRVLATYDKSCAKVVEAASRYKQITDEVNAINQAVRGTDIERVISPDEHYRKEPDSVTPSTSSEHIQFYRILPSGEEEILSVHMGADGNPRPFTNAGFPALDAQRRKIKTTTPERRRPGAYLSGLTTELRLPAGMAGGARFHWPKG